jgi:excisionase family DNA binding protein
MATETYHTVREVALRLRVAEATVRQWIRHQDLRAIDIGKGWRISDHDLDRFLERHQTAPRQAEVPADRRTTGKAQDPR